MNKENKKKYWENRLQEDNEDLPVIEFLDKLDKNQSYQLLEVGSGLCRFVDKIKDIYPNIKITCLDINPDLAKIAKDKGYETINLSFLNNSIKTDTFDIVHCSHVIEHFGYPEITFVLDELLRITKVDGYCIIRSPLMWEKFYYDLDHIRVYPPLSIMHYFTNKQQQKKGESEIKKINLWYRTAPKQYKSIDKSNLLYGICFLRNLWNNHLRKKTNKRLEKMWGRYRYPATKPNGYVLILQKKS